MVDSIHVARWIAQFDASEVEFTLFPSTPNRRVHAMIKDLIVKNGNIKIVPFGGKLSIPLWGMDLVFSDYVRGFLLRDILKRYQPDFVHALELQHGGYITSRALEDGSLKTPFIATNYGSDIYWFQQFPEHLAKIKRLLARADRYSAECHRDVELAKKYGFTGEVMPVFPNAGGFTEEHLNKSLTPASERKKIAVKGYSAWVGRAEVSIKSLVDIRDNLGGFEVEVYSCNRMFRWRLNRLKKQYKLNLRAHLKGGLNHTEMQQLFAESRVYVGLSESDGISTSMLEAMSNGAFPIQSSTACLDEWFVSGQGGYAIQNIGPNEVADHILRSLTDDNLVDNAAIINRAELQGRLSEKHLSTLVRTLYI
jgi:glycosyltransferase involved in cell wall biosynthesis